MSSAPDTRLLGPLRDAGGRRLRAVIPTASQRDFARVRRGLSDRYLHGEGLEVGALHFPLPLPRGAQAKYVDRMAIDQLRVQYPELAGAKLVHVDVIDNGETLATVKPNSQDFVVANHFIEHTQSPLATLQSHLRVLREDGILYLAVPDRQYTFDCDRDPTPVEHIERDYLEGPEWSRRQHFEEWVRYVEHCPDDEVQARVDYLLSIDYSIHFHTWTGLEFVELLVHARSRLELPFDLEALQRNQYEFICVLRKRTAPPPRPTSATHARAQQGVL